MESKRADLGHITVSYGDSETPGPEVIFVHGYPSHWEAYQLFLEALAADFRVLAPSFRGMGGSDRADSYLVRDFVVTSPPSSAP